MALLQHAPTLTTAAASQLARELYGIEATASPLPSERDQNFRLDMASGERFVLKIANATDDRAFLDAQIAAMAHVAAHTPVCARVVPAASGETMAVLPPRFGAPHLVRLVTWLPGVPLAAVPRHSPALLEDLGRSLGKIDAALATFDRPAIHRDFYWDLAGGLKVVADRAPLIDEQLRGVVETLAARIEHHDAPRLGRLRRSAVHNDANDYNVLVDDGSDLSTRHQRVTGLVDFGDMVHSFTVADLAIAVAYIVLARTDPLAAAAAVVRGYHSVLPVKEEEIAALFGLVLLRLCMSAAIAADQQRQRPGDEYLTISQQPIRDALPRLAALDPALAEATFRLACGLELRAAPGVIAAPGPSSAPGSGKAVLLDERRARMGTNLSVAYRDPLNAVRGWMQYLYDERGRRYLDAYNNVPHVGHCHPVVVAAAAEQMHVLNTNTRYLHDNLTRYAVRLTATLPDPLRVCYFVNSGSEANELALRLARAHTRQRDLIVLDAAYHGNTTTLIDISPYKFNGPGGEGAPPWVHVVPLPDVYRGAFRSEDLQAGEKYATFVGQAVDSAVARSGGLAGFIAESAPSVGGQIILPDGYLRAAYRGVRAAGGVCIADEVQTAYGRLGTHFYAFEGQDVVPDIVVLGKPIGNGYPIGAVVTTREIAESFDNGMEFFSTFGGGTVSCAVGLAVLDVVQNERLQEHARRVGDVLLEHLRAIAARHEIVGDVRGSGLFVGVELVTSRETRAPAPAEASQVVNRMREEGILLGTDGPFANVLKIRPPMPFDEKDATLLSRTLDGVLDDLRVTT